MRRGALPLLAVLLVPGCSKLEELWGEQTSEQDESPVVADEDPAPSPDAPSGIDITTAEELIESLGPHRTLRLAPGTYDLSGAETIVGIEGLSLVGQEPGVRLTADDGACSVLRFREVSTLRLENLQIGFETRGEGDCETAVLELMAAKDVTIKNVELVQGQAAGLAVLHAEKVQIEDLDVHDCGGEMAAFVEAKDVEISNSRFHDNGSASAPLRRGFTASRSTVTLTDVTVADNRGNTKDEKWDRLFIFDKDESDRFPAGLDFERSVQFPEASRLVLQGGQVSGNRFAKTGEGDGKLVFVGTEWSRNAMKPPAGTEADESQSGPLVLLDLSIKRKGGGLFAGRDQRYLELSGEAVVNDRIEPGTQVLVRSTCMSEGRRLVDAGYLNVTDYTKPLETLAPDDTAKLNGTLYMHGTKRDLEKCELVFRLGSMSGGVTLPLGTRCFDGSELTDGECRPSLAAAPMSGVVSKKLEIADLTVEKGSSYGGSVALDVRYAVDIHEAGADQTSMTIKAACRTGDKTLVDIAWASVSMMYPAKLEPGESVARYNQLFMDPSLGLDTVPEYCDVSFRSQISRTVPPYGFKDEMMHRVCWREAKTEEGPCDPGAPPPPAPTRPAKDSLTLDGVELTLIDYGGFGKPQKMLDLRGHVTVAKPVMTGAQLVADARCKVGGTTRAENAMVSGHDLAVLGPGESTIVRGSVFGGSPLDKEPSSCSVTFKVQPDYYGAGTGEIKLGKFCLRRGKTKKC